MFVGIFDILIIFQNYCILLFIERIHEKLLKIKIVVNPKEENGKIFKKPIIHVGLTGEPKKSFHF